MGRIAVTMNDEPRKKLTKNKKVRIEQLGPWLLPTLLSPWFTITALVTFGFICAPESFPFIGIMKEGSIVSVLISLALIAVDLVRVKHGTLPPVGIYAWAEGVVAFVVAIGLYVLVYTVIEPPGFRVILFGQPYDLFLLILGPIAVGAISTRLFFCINPMTWLAKNGHWFRD